MHINNVRRLFSRQYKHALFPSFCRFLSSGNVFYDKVERIRSELQIAMTKERYHDLQLKCKVLTDTMQDSSKWDDSCNAAHLSQELASKQIVIEYFDNLQSTLSNVLELYELGESESDEEVLDTCTKDLAEIEESLKQRVLHRIMASPEDESGCYAEIVAGVGGLDAYDWTRMLASMYANWGSSIMGFSVKYIDEHVEGSGSPPLYRRVTLRFDGYQAYGYMKAEAGVHRLVRRSPFDPSDKRHTSFAQVQIYPVPQEREVADRASSFHVDMRYVACCIIIFQLCCSACI